MSAAPILLSADPRIASRTRTVLLTFAIASWCSVVLGIRDVNVLLVVTFAWTSAAALRLTEDLSAHVPARALWSTGFGFKVASGLALSLVLPALKVSFPDWWVWEPLVVPGQMTATGATVALCWPLRPFWVRMPDGRSKPEPLPGAAAETLLLTVSLFFVSGSPVLAFIAIGSALFMLGRRLRDSHARVVASSPARLA